jgi:hypothetical protein
MAAWFNRQTRLARELGENRRRYAGDRWFERDGGCGDTELVGADWFTMLLKLIEKTVSSLLSRNWRAGPGMPRRRSRCKSMKKRHLSAISVLGRANLLMSR